MSSSKTTPDFSNIAFEDFKRLAATADLSRYEKIGFPDSYREGFEEAIFADIVGKLPALLEPGKTVLDIGPGCSDLPSMLSQLCGTQGHTLHLIDSEEMLKLLPDAGHIRKHAAMYPRCPDFLASNQGLVDLIICYSVLHYIVIDVPFFQFIDESLQLLAPGGAMLIGDIPNISKRRRFFSSETGIRFHQAFTGRQDLPEVSYNTHLNGQIDDATVMAIVQRARNAGFDAYVLPQAANLPMANRREDILITRP